VFWGLIGKGQAPRHMQHLTANALRRDSTTPCACVLALADRPCHDLLLTCFVMLCCAVPCCVPVQRVHKVSKQLQQQAASSLTAQGAAAAAQQQLLHITATAAAAAATTAAAAAEAPASPLPGSPAAATTAAAVAAAAGGRGGSSGGEGAGQEPPVLPGLPSLHVSLSASFAGGLGLPAELQQLFKHAAAAPPLPAAAAAAAAAADAAAGDDGPAAAAAEAAGGKSPAAARGAAPTAPLEEIGGVMDEDEELEGFAGNGVLNPGLAGGVNRCSLGLSLTRTPGSAAAGSNGLQPTPGTDAAAAAGGVGGVMHDTPGTIEGGAAGSAGFTPGADGYTPGTAGFTPGSELNPTQDLQQQQQGAEEVDDVLQPLDDVNLGQDDVNLGMDDVNPGGQPGWVMGDGDEEDKENSQGVTPGKGAGRAAAAGGGSSAGGMVWPADAETLQEQDAAGGSAMLCAVLCHAVLCCAVQ